MRHKSYNVALFLEGGTMGDLRRKSSLFKHSVWGILGSLTFGAAFLGLAAAQEKYPNRPINLIVGYPAGGTTDLGARALGVAAGKILGQPVVILNKPGGASSVAMATLKNEKPDGYTIGVLASGAVLSQHMRKVPYDSAQDFTPIMHMPYIYMHWWSGLIPPGRHSMNLLITQRQTQGKSDMPLEGLEPRNT